MTDLSGDDLRRRAELLTKQLTGAAPEGPMSGQQVKELLHELSVHQIELEMQNDALRVAQGELQTSERKFFRLYHHAPVGHLTLNEEGIIQQCNESFMQLVGRDEFRILGRSLAEFVAPADRLQFDRWMKSKDRQLRKISVQSVGDKVDAKHIQLSLTVIEDSNDNPIVLVACVDVTALRVAENRTKLAAAVFETTSEAILVTDAENRIVTINPAFERLTGYNSSDALGQTPRLLKSGKHDAKFYSHVWHQLNKTGHWEGELWNKKKDGTIYAEWKTINVVKDHLNRPQYYISVASDISTRKAMESVIQLQATHDALTQLPNRLLFMDRLQQSLRNAKRSDGDVYLLFLDLDGFKDVNDTLGHDRGDLLLIEAANRLRSCVRETDTVARLGGDEFAVILVGIKTVDDVLLVVNNMLAKIAASYTLVNERVFVTVSIGVTCYPTDARSAETLLKNADQAMYNAKSCGKNCFRFFTLELQQKLNYKQQISKDLHVANVEKEFVLHYQPIVRLSDGYIHKAEALIRWMHPRGELISPADFIPIAEETGKINVIGEWVFRQAAADLLRWRKEFKQDLQLSINKSPVQFRDEKQPMDHWVQHLNHLGLSCNSLVIEITEGLLLEFTDHIKKTLQTYRNNGIEISLDDFGTGYSSLNYIMILDINYLKIDRSFVTNLGKDNESLVLCEAIIAMAHKLGLKVIAEGIETEAQRQILLNAECDYGQGYLFSKPVPREVFESDFLINDPTKPNS